MSSRYKVSREEGILVPPRGAKEDVTFVKDTEMSVKEQVGISYRGRIFYKGEEYMTSINLNML